MTTPPPADPSVARTPGRRTRPDAAPSRTASDPAGAGSASARRARVDDTDVSDTPDSGGRAPADTDDAADTEVSVPAATAAATAPASSIRRSARDARADDPEPEGRRVMGYRRQRFEARKVRRLIRHVDPWSMLKLAVLVALCMWLIVMIAAVVLWTVARNAGTIANVEQFVNSSLSLQDWKLDGDFIFRQFGLITLLLSLGFAAAIVVASLVFNLISDIIGGVWVSVIEEETARPVAESKSAGSKPAGSKSAG